VEGTVENIGLRSTRVRTLDRTLVVIANGKLADMRTECLTARDRMRFATKLRLSTAEDRLTMGLSTEAGESLGQHVVPLTPLKRIMKDYFMVCETYYAAVRTAPPAKIQAIDVNRRALHDEGSSVLKDKLLPKITVDADTARRLFTLVCALHWKG
jgi:uncharacterized protein (UPF0262 family)